MGMTKSSLFSFLFIGNLGAEENIKNQELSMVSQELAVTKSKVIIQKLTEI